MHVKECPVMLREEGKILLNRASKSLYCWELPQAANRQFGMRLGRLQGIHPPWRKQMKSAIDIPAELQDCEWTE